MSVCVVCVMCVLCEACAILEGVMKHLAEVHHCIEDHWVVCILLLVTEVLEEERVN